MELLRRITPEGRDTRRGRGISAGGLRRGWYYKEHSGGRYTVENRAFYMPWVRFKNNRQWETPADLVKYAAERTKRKAYEKASDRLSDER